ncbi:hypothetical protein BWI96_03775 [Siphonobacter sp. SORGH_AS_0500]|nr:hypothetical protein BWI96_03775 [Siphonobacter sp. SORGH_AS_0500]
MKELPRVWPLLNRAELRPKGEDFLLKIRNLSGSFPKTSNLKCPTAFDESIFLSKFKQNRMPLVWMRPFDGQGQVALWEITEELEELQHLFRGSPADIATFQEINHPQKQREFLASRILIQTLVESVGETYHGIRKDIYDKPFLHNTNSHFSLSHSLRFAAVIWHPVERVGIDIEPISEKLAVVSHKYLSETEQEHAQKNLRKLGIYWTGKEALYKLYGEKKLSFKGNILIEPFSEESLHITGWIRTETESKSYQLEVIAVEDCILTVVAE